MGIKLIRVSLLSAYYIANCIAANDKFAAFITLPMFFLCLLNLIRISANQFDFRDMFWVSAYFFFVIGPCQSLNHGRFADDSPVEGIQFASSDIVEAMSVVVLFFGTITAINFIMYKPKAAALVRRCTIASNKVYALVFINMASFIGYILSIGGIENALASRYAKSEDTSYNLSTVFLGLQLVSVFLIAAIFVQNYGKKRADTFLSFLLCVGLLLISQNIFNTPRYFLLASWLPLLLVLLRGRIKVSVLYPSIFAAVMVLMPALSLTSRNGTDLSSAMESVDIIKGFFRISSIDVFDMLVFEMKYMHDHFFYYGSKTLGLIFFFIPRSIWTGKATLMGLDLGNDLYNSQIVGTPNLSFFVGGDFFADFGFVGVLAGAAVIGFLISRMFAARRTLICNQDIQRYIFIAALPILIRGPLGANAPLFAIQLVWLTLMIFLFRNQFRTSDVSLNVSGVQPGQTTSEKIPADSRV